MRFTLLLSLAVLVSAEEAPRLRLPGDVRPQSYSLELRLSPEQDTYSGKVAIDVRVLRKTGVVWLHSNGLTIRSARVGPGRAEVVQGGRELIGLKAPVRPGATTIEIEFTGAFNKNDVEGLFKQVEAGESYLFTQFEPTAARRAFPCFDEPSFKTPWKLTLHVPAGQRAFANTPVLSENAGADGIRTIRFAQSKPLPTYLVAMAVGPFDISEAGVAGRNRFPVRTVTLKGRAAEAKFTDSVTPKIVAALEEYFGIPYPYEKLDQVTIPITVAFGAMENAGLITYRQTLLLSKPQDETLPRQRAAASVIAHELAHQWFGNMVTPAWWDDIWLNEAFATWLATKIVDDLHPEWHSKTSAVQRKAEVMAEDGLLSARRIRQPIVDQGDIGNAFDGITYQKGSAVIRMFEQYVGQDRFRRGVQNYMRKHAWGNATASDFLSAISAAAGKNITAAFSGFLDRGGLPLMTVELNCDGQPRVAVAQQRSLPLGSKGSRDEYWSVPVCFRYEVNGKVSRHCALISDPRDEVTLAGASGCPEWLTASDEAGAYFHVLYRGSLTTKLLANSDKLALHERVELLRNALALLRGGHMPVADAMEFAGQFRSGPSTELILASMEIVSSIRRFVPDALRPEYAALIREYYGAKAREIGWTPKQGDTAEIRLLRPKLLGFVARQGEDAALASEAGALARRWLGDHASVSADVAGAVLETAAYHGDAKMYEALVADGVRTRNRRDRDLIVRAIGNFRDPEIAARALGLMLGTGMETRELTTLLDAFTTQPSTQQVPWQFVVSNYDQLLPRLPSRLGTHGGSILPVAGKGFCDASGYTAVQTFFKERIQGIDGGERVLAKVLEEIELCAARIRVQGPEVAEYLRRRQSR